MKFSANGGLYQDIITIFKFFHKFCVKILLLLGLEDCHFLSICQGLIAAFLLHSFSLFVPKTKRLSLRRFVLEIIL